jgi:hypothetical protein
MWGSIIAGVILLSAFEVASTSKTAQANISKGGAILVGITDVVVSPYVPAIPNHAAKTTAATTPATSTTPATTTPATTTPATPALPTPAPAGVLKAVA